MKTVSEVKQAQTAAGVAYAKAARAFAEAYVDLLALDLTCENSAVGLGLQRPFTTPLQIPPHAPYLPERIDVDIYDRAKARVVENLKSLGVEGY